MTAAFFQRIRAFVRLGRPQFLGGGLLLFALGALVAVCAGAPFRWSRHLVGQLAVTAFQLMTHYANDYFDLEADQANTTPTRWSGGSRVLVSGEIPRGAALLAALVLAALGLGVTAHLGTRADAGPWVVPIAIAMFVFAWEYSAPPLRLHSTGLGELDTALVVTALVPLFGFHLQSPGLVGLRVLLLAIVPLCALQIAMLLAIELPDRAGDASVGKRTLVVRWGPRRGALAYAVVTALAFAGVPALVLAGLPALVGLSLAAVAPLAAWRVCTAARRDGHAPARWKALTFWSVALLALATVAELSAFALLARR